MNNAIKLLKLPVLLGFIIVCGFVFSGCSKYGVPVTTHKKWVNWQIEFNPNSTEKEQQRVFFQLQTYVLNYLDAVGGTVYFINFKRIFKSPNLCIFQVSAGTSIKGAGATKAPMPMPGGPREPVPDALSPGSFWKAVKSISLNIGGNFGNNTKSQGL